MVMKKNSGRPTNRPDVATLDELYKDHTATEIAAMYKVSPSCVRSWVMRYRRELAHAGAQSTETE